METRSFNKSERAGLQSAFDVELVRLRRIFPGDNRVEDIMRLRALGEIADCLDTSQLVQLSVTVGALAPRSHRAERTAGRPDRALSLVRR